MEYIKYHKIDFVVRYMKIFLPHVGQTSIFLPQLHSDYRALSWESPQNGNGEDFGIGRL
jgi:hypothetical protein